MKKEMMRIPTQCRECKAIYDLSYDLLKLKEQNIDINNPEILKMLVFKGLCWECRQKYPFSETAISLHKTN